MAKFLCCKDCKHSKDTAIKSSNKDTQCIVNWEFEGLKYCTGQCIPYYQEQTIWVQNYNTVLDQTYAIHGLAETLFIQQCDLHGRVYGAASTEIYQAQGRSQKIRALVLDSSPCPPCFRLFILLLNSLEDMMQSFSYGNEDTCRVCPFLNST